MSTPGNRLRRQIRVRVAGNRGEVRRHPPRVEEDGERRGMPRAVSPAGELLRVPRVVAVVRLEWHSIELELKELKWKLC